ncbi:MAG: hypothetical protein QOF56_1880 [Acidobacteriaceae bacterium]|nr:hypothetical protein [Acidobacteriaceae bacterium]
MSSFSRFGLLMAVATTALLAGCKHGQQDTSRPGEQTKPPSGSTLGIAGRMLDGADQATIRTYLQTVQDVKPKKFSVQWSPDTVPVTRDEALRSLQSIDEDGSLYTFASSEPVVGRLAPGRILWIWDVAIRRIDSVANLGDVTIVRTKPVALTQALPEADIEFETAPNFADAYGGLRPHSPKQPPPQKSSEFIRRPSFRLAALNTDEPEQPKPGDQPGDQKNPAPSDEDDNDYGLVAATQDGYNGRVGGFEYSMEYKVSPNRLSYEFEARKEEEKGGSGENNEIHRDQRDEYFELVKEQREALHEERILAARIADLDQQLNAAQNKAVAAAGKSDASFNAIIIQLKGDKIAAYKEYNKYKDEAAADEAKMKKLAAAGALAKKVFYIISDNLDVRFRSKVDLDRSAFSGSIHTAGGSLTQFAAHFKDMKGNVELEFVGRLGQGGNGAVSVPVVNVPVVMNIPVPVEGIPLVVQFATNFMVKLFLAGNHATQHFTIHFQFNGGAGLDSTSNGTNTEGNLSSSKPEVGEKTAMSPGTSGLVLAVQLPRFGLGVGFLGSHAMAYMDLVHVLTMTNSASVAALNPQCHRYTFDTIGSVGVDVSVVPIPFPLVQTAASKALSQRKEVWRAPQWKFIEPDIAMCRLGGD